MDEINLKILLVGDASVGKTSILLRYIDEHFPNKHIATVGVEYRVKTFVYRGFKIKLQIWDTAGQERFHSITNNYFHNSDGILFVYDITNKRSFEGIKVWIIESEEFGDFKKLLLGNKCDLKHRKNVSDEEVKFLCNEKNMENYEISAKENINLKKVFDKIVELIFKDKNDNEIRELFGTKSNDHPSVTTQKKHKRKKEVICC